MANDRTRTDQQQTSPGKGRDLEPDEIRGGTGEEVRGIADEDDDEFGDDEDLDDEEEEDEGAL